MKRIMALGAVFAVLGIIAAGCGGSGSDSTGSTSGGEASEATNNGGGGGEGGSDAVEAAETKLGELTKEPPKVEIPPMKKAPMSGAQIDFVGCPLPVCVEVEEGVEGAAKALGWSVKPVNQGLTPSTVQSAWNAVAQDPPDGVVSTTILPNEQISKQLDQLNGIPYVGSAQGGPLDKWMKGQVAGPRAEEADGEALAAWVVKESGGEPEETIYVWDPSLNAIVTSHTGYHAEMEKLCPECTVTDLKVSTGDSGTKMPEQIVNEVRTHPDAKYLVFNLGDYTAGVPQALKAANLTPELVTRAASTTNMEQIQNGEMAAALTTESIEAGWRATDLLARLMNGEELYEEGLPEGVRTFLTEENLPEDISVPFTVPGFEQTFEEAWGK